MDNVAAVAQGLANPRQWVTLTMPKFYETSVFNLLHCRPSDAWVFDVASSFLENLYPPATVLMWYVLMHCLGKNVKFFLLDSSNEGCSLHVICNSEITVVERYERLFI